MKHSIDAVPTQEEEQRFWDGYHHRARAAAAGWSKPVTKPGTLARQNRIEDAARLNLLSGHITDLPHLEGENREWAGELQVWKDGSIAKVTHDTSYRPTDDYRHRERPHLPNVKGAGRRGGGIRGKVDSKFSRKARLRMLRETGKLDNRTRPYFVTLTFRDEVYTGIDDAKKALENFRRNLMRRWPNAAALWRMEMVKRKSGARVGEYLPHFHLLIWPNVVGHAEDTGQVKRNKLVRAFKCKPGFLLTKAQYKEFQQWVNTTWGTVASGNGLNQVKAVYDNRGVSNYVAKYVAKVDEESADDAAYPDDTGRLWGKWNEQNLPISEIVSLSLSSPQARGLMRLFRHWCGMDDADIPWGPSLHCHISPGWFLENLDRLLEAVTFEDTDGNMPSAPTCR